MKYKHPRPYNPPNPHGFSKETLQQVLEWYAFGDVGCSSKAIADYLLGYGGDGSYPHDGGDFGRCEKLLNDAPELRTAFAKMAERNRYWAALIPVWNEISKTPEQGKWHKIRKVLEPLHNSDPNVVIIDDGQIRFGEI